MLHPTLPAHRNRPATTDERRWRSAPGHITLSVFQAQTGDAVEQVSSGSDAMRSSFQKIGSASFCVDKQCGAGAGICLKGMVLDHRVALLSWELPPFAAKRMLVAAVRGLADRTRESGTPEDVPRTAAIDVKIQAAKSAAISGRSCTLVRPAKIDHRLVDDERTIGEALTIQR